MTFLRRVSFAYVVQLDLPGFPVKVGHTTQPNKRFDTFRKATPVPLNVIGVTIGGCDREKELLAAISGSRIHGEWGHPTEELQAEITASFEAGNWYVPAADQKAHMLAKGVPERVKRYARSYPIHFNSINYQWASEVLKLARHDDPLLGLDWSGYKPATTPPILRGLVREARASA